MDIPPSDHFNFMLLGSSGSGKSTYLAGLSGTLVNLSCPLFGYSFSLRSLKDTPRLNESQLIDWPEFIDQGYPPATVREIELGGSLWMENERLASLSFYDYRGGDTTSLIRPDKREDVSQKLLGQLDQTDCLLVFVSAVDLVFERHIEKKDWADITYNSYHTPLGYFDKIAKIVHVLRQRRPGVGLIFMVSKVDALVDLVAQFPKELQSLSLVDSDGRLRYQPLLADVCEMTQHLTQNHTGPCAVIPISSTGIGQTRNRFSIVETRLKQGTVRSIQMTSLLVRAPKPMNLHLPIVYPIAWLLKKAKYTASHPVIHWIRRRKPYHRDILEQLMRESQIDPQWGVYDLTRTGADK